MGQLITSISSVTLFTSYINTESIQSVYVTLSYDEQFYSTQNKLSEISKMKKNNRMSKQSYEIRAAHAFNVYNINKVFYIYLHVITKSGLKKCIGEAKIDNFAHHVITSRQKGESGKDEDHQSFLFFPHTPSNKRSTNAIAEGVIKYTYSPYVSHDCLYINMYMSILCCAFQLYLLPRIHAWLLIFRYHLLHLHLSSPNLSLNSV